MAKITQVIRSENDPLKVLYIGNVQVTHVIRGGKR